MSFIPRQYFPHGTRGTFPQPLMPDLIVFLYLYDFNQIVEEAASPFS